MLLAAGFQELDDCVPYSGKIVPGEQDEKKCLFVDEREQLLRHPEGAHIANE